jgi:2-polyprenyl-3-methyl-5-hydroxy-6-metoxy-1,4-benzoquinol methylase
MLMVLGAHRSGTSALAGVIQRLGVELGENLLGPQAGVNERGFGEHSDLVALHDHLLGQLGSRWDSIHPLPEKWWQSSEIDSISREISNVVERDFGNTKLWGLKDPRLCRLLPLWLNILEQRACEPSFVIIYRNPLEVTASLSRRDRMETQQALNIWLQHILDAELYSRGYPRAIISYRQLLEDWRGTMRSVGELLSLQWPANIDQAEREIVDFLDDSLRHHQLNKEALSGVPSWIRETYACLEQAYQNGDEDLQPQFDRLGREYRDAVSLFSPLLLSEEQKFREVDSGFKQACAIIEAKNAAEQQQMKTLQDVEAGFKQSIEMLNEKDAELAKMNALLTDRVRSLARALDEWVEHPPQKEKAESQAAENDKGDDKVYEGVIDLRVSNNSHTQLYNFIQEDSAGRHSRVLEAGCSSGYFGEALKKAGHEVWGVEMSPGEAARARKKLDHVFVGTIEEFLGCEAVNGVRFDYITFGDVLEHLVYPQQVLKDCRRFLRPGGCIAASIPNVAHKAVRLMLMEGRWDYADFGILDNTHLRFFTRNSIVDMFTNAGFDMRRMDIVTLPPDATGIDVSADLLQSTSELLPENDGDVFQFTSLSRMSESGDQLAGHNHRFHQGSGANILCLLPFADWSVGNIRIRDPLMKYCQQYGGHVRIRSIYEHKGRDIAWADTVILQRDSNRYVLGLVDNLQKMGKRLIVDMDDLLTEIPPFLLSYDHCQQIRPYLLETLRMADAITVTTQRLKDEMTAYNSHVFVAPNCVSSAHEPVRHFDSETHRVNLLVASTDTVRVDFIVSALKRVTDDGELNTGIVCIGPPGDFLQDTGLSVQAHDNMDYAGFKAFLATLDNTIGIIPLDDSRFSGCKSPVKYLDFSLAGIPAVCSDVLPYSNCVNDGETGILCANNEDSWYQALRELVLSASRRTEIANAARRFSASEFPLKHAAGCWNEVLANTQPGQGQEGSELLSARRSIPLFLHHMMNPSAYRLALQVLRREGISGVRARLSRLI